MAGVLTDGVALTKRSFATADISQADGLESGMASERGHASLTALRQASYCT